VLTEEQAGKTVILRLTLGELEDVRNTTNLLAQDEWRVGTTQESSLSLNSLAKDKMTLERAIAEINQNVTSQSLSGGQAEYNAQNHEETRRNLESRIMALAKATQVDIDPNFAHTTVFPH
jgi:hypothetical protein